MARIRIDAEVPDDVSDPSREGLTQEGWQDLMEALEPLGYEDITVRKAH